LNCSICGKPIILIPSAQERARKDVCGNPASYYTAIFTTHADCALAKSRQETSDLLVRLRHLDPRVTLPCRT
jgi:hypothetical protein